MFPLCAKTTRSVFCLEPLESRCLLTPLPVISEFLAEAEESKLADGYGRLDNDWIEIYNPGNEPVDLSRWYLTDEPDNLKKWPFPDVQQYPQVRLPPDGYLVVFASDDRVPDPLGNLHTNFKLKQGGDFLALVMQDGETIAHWYRFPPQDVDVSFGIDQATVSSLVSQTADVEYLVPEDASQLKSGWRDVNFVDSSGIWKASPRGNGVGFFPTYTNSGQTLRTDIRSSMYRSNGSVFVRIPFGIGGAADLAQLELDITYNDGFIAYLNGVEIGRANAPESPAWNSTATARTQDDVIAYQEVDISQHRELLRETGNVLAIQGLNSALNDRVFYVRAELTGLRRRELRPDDQTPFREPTPGSMNRPEAGRLSEQVTFSRPPGLFRSSFELELSVSIPDAQIYYTLNGQAPVVDSSGALRNGSAYRGRPITIDQNTTVKALAYSKAAGGATSVSAAGYDKVTSGLQDFDSSLPIIMIDGLPGAEWMQGEQTYVSGSVISTVDGQASVTDRAKFRGRFAIERIDDVSQRSSYLVQIIGEDGSAGRASLLDMPEGSQWLLDAVATDPTLLRNAIVYGWANGMGNYAPRTRAT